MCTETYKKVQPNHKLASTSLGGTIEKGISSSLSGFLATLCRWTQTTPNSIMKSNPNIRPNSPPASGGVSSLGH